MPAGRASLHNVDPAAALALHSLGGIGHSPFDPERAVDARPGGVDRHFGQIGEHDQLFVAALGTTSHPHASCRKFRLEVGHLDEQIGALDGEALLAEHVVHLVAMGRAIGDQDELAFVAIPDLRIGKSGQKCLGFHLRRRLPKHERSAPHSRAMPHLGGPERIGLQGEFGRHPHTASARATGE